MIAVLCIFLQRSRDYSIDIESTAGESVFSHCLSGYHRCPLAAGMLFQVVAGVPLRRFLTELSEPRPQID